jgi:tRNA U34 5-carboxymethylaminomethyl modifying enzyme MnmG/GidA
MPVSLEEWKQERPRVDGRSLDYSKMNEEKGDAKPDKYSDLLTAFDSSKVMSYDLYPGSMIF